MNLFLKLHLLTITPVLLLGPFILFSKKGDKKHLVLGRIWACLMVVSCLLSFGVTHNGKYSWLHGLSLLTIWQVGRGIVAIRKKNIRRHKRALIIAYSGAVIAFVFAATMPDRLIGSWIFSYLE